MCTWNITSTHIAAEKCHVLRKLYSALKFIMQSHQEHRVQRIYHRYAPPVEADHNSESEKTKNIIIVTESDLLILASIRQRKKLIMGTSITFV